MAEQLLLQWDAPPRPRPPRGETYLHEVFHGLERRIFASQEAGLAMRAELAQLVPPATLFELDRRAPPARRKGEAIIMSSLGAGPGMLTRGTLHPLERYWKDKLELQREGKLRGEMRRLVKFARWTQQLRQRVLAQAGPELMAHFSDECKDTLQEELLYYWRRRWAEVRILYLVAEFCDHEWCYRGWWMYEREAPDQVYDQGGDSGWLRNGACAVEDYCKLLGVDGLPAIEGERYGGRPRDQAFIEAFAKRFPQGLPARVSRRGFYHRPDCFTWSEQLRWDESCRCGAYTYREPAPAEPPPEPAAKAMDKKRRARSSRKATI